MCLKNRPYSELPPLAVTNFGANLLAIANVLACDLLMPGPTVVATYRNGTPGR
jgi:hypothetical protein